MKERWLDVGCGSDKVSGAIGVDQFPLPGVDIVWNLNQYPWPFEDGCFDRIICNHSLQILENFVRAIEEIHRIAKDRATVEILAPHFASDNFNNDPCSRTHVGVRTMNFFCEELPLKYHYYSKARFKMVTRNISFRDNKPDFQRRIKFNIAKLLGLEQLVNSFPRVYERFFSYILPASEVYFKVQVLKESV
jgi:ubiquinone/menaquinone biosynthesis C-methylase UbiE